MIWLRNHCHFLRENSGPMVSEELENIIGIRAMDVIVIIGLGLKMTPAAEATVIRALTAKSVIFANLHLQAIAFLVLFLSLDFF